MGALGPDSQAGQAPPATHTSQRWPAARQIHLAGRSTGSLSPLPPWAPSSSTTQGAGSRRRPGDNLQHRTTHRWPPWALGSSAGREPPAEPVHPPGRRQWPPWAPSSSATRGTRSRPPPGGHLPTGSPARPPALATCSTGSPAWPPAVATLSPGLVGGPGATCRTGSPAGPPAVATLGPEPAAARGPPRTRSPPPPAAAGHLGHRITHPPAATLGPEFVDDPGHQVPPPARGPPPHRITRTATGIGHLQHRFTRLAAGSGHPEPWARRRPGATCSTGSPAWAPSSAATRDPVLSMHTDKTPPPPRPLRSPAPAGGPPDHPPSGRQWPP